MRHLTLITTGGTIEKTYDEMTGELSNRKSVVRRMLRRLRQEDTAVSIIELIAKDSLHMTDDDRGSIVKAVERAQGRGPRAQDSDSEPRPSALSPAPCSGIVILHGTDTLAITGEYILKNLSPITVPIVLTGAMRPFEMTRSDALQNLTEAMFAVGILAPGVYCSAHGRVLQFPGVRKDRERGTFVRA